MPLKLIEPREGRSENYRIRGTYLGYYLDRSTGTADKRLAKGLKAKLERDIERGELASARPLTFAAAALSYLNADGEDRFLKPIIDYFGPDKPLVDIDQAAIDTCAVTLYPKASPATRNRQVYTPISAVLRHAGIERQTRRPKGAQGQERVQWLWPEQAETLFAAAKTVDPKFRAFLILLTYCGPRLSEALRITTNDVRLGEAFAYCGRTKNGEPRPMHLPPVVVAALAGLDLEGAGKVFRWHRGGYLYGLMRDTRKAAGLPWVSFHTLRHTYGTWMRRYGGLDTRGLVATGAWKNEKSAARYAHVIVSEEAQRSNMLPSGGKKLGRSNTRTRAKSVESA